MTNEERTKTLINNIKLNINEPNVYEFGLCVEQWKQILDYIEQLQQENKKYKEVIDKVIKEIKKELKENNHLSYGVALSIIVTLNYYEEILKGDSNE